MGAEHRLGGRVKRFQRACKMGGKQTGQTRQLKVPSVMKMGLMIGHSAEMRLRGNG